MKYIFFSLFALVVTHSQATQMPVVVSNGEHAGFYVDGKPFLVLGGELHNSSASSTAYMAPIWPHLKKLNLNTVILPVYWELTEPKEGEFDLTLVQNHIEQARQHNLKLVFLWFGAMKNAKSTYAPGWVLADQQRFPRAQVNSSYHSKSKSPLSIFNPALVEADAKAFTALMSYLDEFDTDHTVIAVQVENESGLLGDSRDRSALAEQVWREPVPSKLMTYLTRNQQSLAPELLDQWQDNGFQQQGTWQEVFGDSAYAESLFMAYGVSQYIETLASRGKQQKALPMYANAWIGPQNSGDKPGQYPSGGPVPNVFDIWKATATSLDWLSPDIYVDDFNLWASRYATKDNLLFVPEAHFIVANVFSTFGRFKGFGFSPFGIEDGIEGNQISIVYEALHGMMDILVNAQQNNKIASVVLDDKQAPLTLGNYVIKTANQVVARKQFLLDLGVTFNDLPAPSLPQNTGDVMRRLSDNRPMGLFIQTAENEFIVFGKNLHFTFSELTSPDSVVEYDRIEEGVFKQGKWHAGRVLNGDERISLLPDYDFRLLRIRLLPAQ